MCLSFSTYLLMRFRGVLDHQHRPPGGCQLGDDCPAKGKKFLKTIRLNLNNTSGAHEVEELDLKGDWCDLCLEMGKMSVVTFTCLHEKCTVHRKSYHLCSFCAEHGTVKCLYSELQFQHIFPGAHKYERILNCVKCRIELNSKRVGFKCTVGLEMYFCATCKVKNDRPCHEVHFGLGCDGCKKSPMVADCYMCIDNKVYGKLCRKCKEKCVPKLIHKNIGQGAPLPNIKINQTIACDGCNNAEPIIGPRFKCDTCADYDLCGECMKKDIHYEHKLSLQTLSCDHHKEDLDREGKRCLTCKNVYFCRNCLDTECYSGHKMFQCLGIS